MQDFLADVWWMQGNNSKCQSITGVSEVSRIQLTQKDPSAMWLEKLLNPQRPIFKISSSGREWGKLGNVNIEALIWYRSSSDVRQQFCSGRFSLPGPPPRLLSMLLWALGTSTQPNPFVFLHFYYLYSINISFRSSVWQHCWPAHCFGKLGVHNRAPSVVERFRVKLNCHISAPSHQHFGCFPKTKCSTFEIQHLTMMCKLLQANGMADYGRVSKFRLDNLRQK